MEIDYTNFFAMLPPFSNITKSGRLPQKLESFRINLPCSGRINAEVAVIIRFKFHLKHFKGSSGNHTSSRGNATTISLMRNKICLLQEFIPTLEEPVVIGTKPPTPPSTFLEGGGSSPAVVSNSTLLLFQDPTPSLLLAGLLGGCAVTASIVFLIFFICLRRKLVPSPRSSPLSSAYSGGGIINSDPNSSSNNSSPACLLRQSAVVGGDSKWTKESCCDSSTFKDKYSNPTSTIGSRNSYVTIASFWNDIFGTHGNSHHSSPSLSVQQPPQHQRVSSNLGPSHSHSHNPRQHANPSPQLYTHSQSQLGNNYHLNSAFNSSQATAQSGVNNSIGIKGSDVSPYAYAHIVPKIAPPPPPLIEWYSESTCNNGGHIFTNNLYTFQPNPVSHPHSSSHGAPGPPAPKFSTSLHGDNSTTITNDGNASTTTRSTGSGSLIQIDGFQCRKNLIKDSHIVERFL
ncbi:unnamed protein product [Allacma fusca]|uniref:WIF domain-containing protein n=1 Tax=Allacma fusca TaxID=39272 RepID=A0A8J2L5Z9_9HEXA|nr:unnamed protein product [Allacma fusca]